MRITEHLAERRRQHEVVDLPDDLGQFSHPVGEEVCHNKAGRRRLAGWLGEPQSGIPQPGRHRGAALHQYRDEGRVPPALRLLGQYRVQFGLGIGDVSDFDVLGGRPWQYRRRQHLAHQFGTRGAVDPAGIAAGGPAVLFVGAFPNLPLAFLFDGGVRAKTLEHPAPAEKQSTPPVHRGRYRRGLTAAGHDSVRECIHHRSPSSPEPVAAPGAESPRLSARRVGGCISPADPTDYRYQRARSPPPAARASRSRPTMPTTPRWQPYSPGSPTRTDSWTCW